VTGVLAGGRVSDHTQRSMTIMRMRRAARCRRRAENEAFIESCSRGLKCNTRGEQPTTPRVFQRTLSARRRTTIARQGDDDV